MALKERDIKESFYYGVPLLNIGSSLAREAGRVRRRGEQKTANMARIGADIITFDTATPHYEIPSLEYLTRLQRRETIINRQIESVHPYEEKWNHKRPAEIANSLVRIDSPQGIGYLPFESSHILSTERASLDDEYHKRMSKIKEIYIIQHGVMRNAKDYHKYFMEALGKKYDPETMLVIAPQFTAPVDLANVKQRDKKTVIKHTKQGAFISQTGEKRINSTDIFQLYSNGLKTSKLWDKVSPDDVLRWRYNDWRGAEPALNPDAPIDSFTAMDTLIQEVMRLTPNVDRIEFRGNSEGGQCLDRYLAFSKTLNELESRKESPIKINAIVSNPGTVLYFDPMRPKFDQEGNIVAWNKNYKFNSRENMWPFGLYDAPPYILESLAEWPTIDSEKYPYMDTYDDPYDFALANYLRRTIMTIGQLDDVVGGFHLPKGPGPAYAAQGNTRYRRMKGKFESIWNIFKKKRASGITFPELRWKILGGVEHDAREVFLVTEPFEQIAKASEIYTGRSYDHVS